MISVIIPTYNGAEFVAKALDSALMQENVSCEVIVVNDGSTDHTRDVLAPYAVKGQIRYIEQPNMGVAVARNRGAAEAKYDWLAFLDCDDWWDRRKLALQLEAGTSNLGVIYTDRRNVGQPVGIAEIQSQAVTLFEGHVFDKLLLGNFVTLSSVMLHKRLFETVGGFCEDREISPAEDWDLWIRLARKCDFICCHQPLTYYRWHHDGASRNWRRLKRAMGLVLDRASKMHEAARISADTWRIAWANLYSVVAMEAGAGSMAAIRYRLLAILRSGGNKTYVRAFLRELLQVSPTFATKQRKRMSTPVGASRLRS